MYVGSIEEVKAHLKNAKRRPYHMNWLELNKFEVFQIPDEVVDVVPPSQRDMYQSEEVLVELIPDKHSTHVKIVLTRTKRISSITIVLTLVLLNCLWLAIQQKEALLMLIVAFAIFSFTGFILFFRWLGANKKYSALSDAFKSDIFLLNKTRR